MNNMTTRTNNIFEFRALPTISAIAFLTKRNISGFKDWWAHKNDSTAETADLEEGMDYLFEYNSWQQCVFGPVTNTLFHDDYIRLHGYSFITDVLDDSSERLSSSNKSVIACGIFELHSKLLHKASEILHQTLKETAVSDTIMKEVLTWFTVVTSNVVRHIIVTGSDEGDNCSNEGNNRFLEIKQWHESLQQMQTSDNHERAHPFFDTGIIFVHIADIVYQAFEWPVFKGDLPEVNIQRVGGDIKPNLDEEEFKKWTAQCHDAFKELFHQGSLFGNHFPIVRDRIFTFEETMSTNRPSVHTFHGGHLLKAKEQIENTLNKSIGYEATHDEVLQQTMFGKIMVSWEKGIRQDTTKVRNNQKERFKHRQISPKSKPRIPTNWENDSFMLGDKSIYSIHQESQSLFSKYNRVFGGSGHSSLKEYMRKNKLQEASNEYASPSKKSRPYHNS